VVPIASVTLGGYALNRGALATLAALGGSVGWVAAWVPLVTMITATLWFGGATAFLFRSVVRWMRARTLVRRGVRLAGDELQDASRRICRSFSILKRIDVLISTLARVPTVIGWVRPVILLPISSVTGLTPEQLRMVIAHELAHVARHDYLVNLFQVGVESLMFYHPGVWWLSERIRTEREYCCDDLAVASSGSVAHYAHALAALEESRDAARTLAVAATGGSLLDRIARMGAGGEVRACGTSHPMQAVVMAVVLIVVAVVCGLSSSTPAVPEFQHLTERPAELQIRASADASATSGAESTATDGTQPRRRRSRRPASR